MGSTERLDVVRGAGARRNSKSFLLLGHRTEARAAARVAAELETQRRQGQKEGERTWRIARSREWPMPMEISLPGQALEKAVGDVGTYASKRLIDSLYAYGRSFLVPGIAKREAQGRQVAARIDQLSENERQDLEIAARRRRELEERDHELSLDLRARAAARFVQEIEQEQLSIDAIVKSAVKKVEQLGEDAEPRDMEPDWIRAFFKYAKDVTNDKIRGIFADILAEASITEGQLLPPKILDIIRFMDKETVEEFEKISRYISLYGFITEAFANTLAERGLIKSHALEALEEFGLIKRSYIYMSRIQIGQFLFNISLDVGSAYRFDSYKLSQAGSKLIDIINEDIRVINGARGKPELTGQLWLAQRRLNISTAEFRSFSRHVISEVSDARHVQIQINARLDEGSFRTLAAVEKRETFDPFHLAIPASDLEKYDQENAEFARVFEAVFRDYDENTLPSMTRNDEGGADANLAAAHVTPSEVKSRGDRDALPLATRLRVLADRAKAMAGPKAREMTRDEIDALSE